MTKKYLILILSFLILILILLKNQKNNTETKPDPEKLIKTIKSINSKNSKIMSIFSDQITYKRTKSILYYEKPNKFLLIIKSKIGKELEIGFNDVYYWFWIKNFDSKNLYYCKKENLNKTNVKPILHPQVLSSILGINELDKSTFDFVQYRGMTKGTQEQNGLKRIIIFDDEKIVEQKYYEKEQLILETKVKSFFEYEGVKIPKEISLSFCQEGFSLEIDIKPEEINKEKNIEIPSDLPKIQLDAD